MRIFLLLCVFCSFIVQAKVDEHYHRAYWYPMYYGERLAYCSKNEARCGKPIANDYCQLMGYQNSVHSRIAHNVGRTHFFAKEGECTGWKCDGFLLIECEGKFKHKPAEDYIYRMKKFVYPRFQNHRVAWCYKQHQACGHRAAYAFCRRMGYSKAESYTADTKIAATRTLGDYSLCYGKTCKGFENIICKR